MHKALYCCIRKFLLILWIVLLSLSIASLTFAQEPSPTPQPASINNVGFSLYIPIILLESTDTDLTIGFVEITQAVQTFDNSVTLVENRQTLARIYTQTNTQDPVNGVLVSISAYKDGSLLPGSPLIIGPGTVPLTWSRADINKSFNSYLPSNWLSGTVTLEITLDPNNAIEEKDETNNITSKVMNFITVPPLNITVVPIRYHHMENGKTYLETSSSFIQSAFLRMYPVSTVNVSVRSYFYFSGNLDYSSDWSDLLNEITNLKLFDNAPDSQIYYGLIPLLDNNGFSWWNGGYAGLGWVGYRESIGLTEAYLKQYNYYVLGKDIANHEVGHNLNQRHAPCGGAGNVDPQYPYPDGTVGQYGLDMTTFQVMPATYYDVMSYCDPVWISDYTYLSLLQNQKNYGLPETSLQTTDSLYIRVSIEENDSISLQPVYSLLQSPDRPPQESEFSLEFFNSAGEVVATNPLTVRLAESQELLSRSIQTVIPRPSQPFSSIRLTRNGMPVSERLLTQDTIHRAFRPTLQFVNGELILDWEMPVVPAIVRYTTDNGESWNTLGVDILGGELRIDPQLLPMGPLLFEIILADRIDSTMSITWEHLP